MSPPALKDINSLPQNLSEFPDFINQWPVQCHLREQFSSYPDGVLPPSEFPGGDDRPSENWANGALNTNIAEVSSWFHSFESGSDYSECNAQGTAEGSESTSPEPPSILPSSSGLSRKSSNEDATIVGEVSMPYGTTFPT